MDNIVVTEGNVEALINENDEQEHAGNADKKTKKKRSSIWQHYSTLFVDSENGPEEYAKCNYCIA